MVSIAPKSLLLIGLAAAIVAPAPHDAPSVACAHPVPAREGLALARAVWPPDRWRRGKPKPAALRAHRTQLRCAAGPGHRKAIRRRWRIERRSYFEHRRAELWRVRVTPFRGCTSSGCGWYAVPAYIVECESGGRYNDPAAPNGAYSMLTGPLQGVPTWETWRPDWADRWATPWEAPKRAQDIAAHRLWAAYGSEPWECA